MCYAIADVLGGEPGDLLTDLRQQHSDDDAAVAAAINDLERQFLSLCSDDEAFDQIRGHLGASSPDS